MELNTWKCKQCGVKNYFSTSPDIHYMGNEIRVWRPKKGVYEKDTIKCHGCGAPYPREPTFSDIIYEPQKTKCPECGHEFHTSRKSLI